MNDDKPIMYIFVNSELNLSSGGAAVQCCHITQKIIENIYQESTYSLTPSEIYINYMKWRKEPIKIILRATTEQLNDIKNIEGASIYEDNVRHSDEKYLTVVGITPNYKMSKLTEKYKLY